MGLNNSQYDTIMRHYSQLQLNNQHRLDEHRRIAYEAIPELSDMDRQIGADSIRTARLLLENPQIDLEALRSRARQSADLRAQLLREHGFSEDYLTMTYSCPDCQDTGYHEGRKCHCFRRQAIDLFYTQSGLKEVLQEENFLRFSYDYYPDDLTQPATGRSSREQMKLHVASCLRFIDEFDDRYDNLFFYGGTGLGKTFLSHCIARELIEREHSVIYFSAYDLFELFAKHSFGREQGDDGMHEYVTDCDLLIIDDLGTELTNSFVVSTLFQILNERIQNKKSVIISTNLSLDQFAGLYTERVFSRISSNFQLMQLFGNDIRLQKKLRG